MLGRLLVVDIQVAETGDWNRAVASRMERRPLPALWGYAVDQYKSDNVMEIILES